VDLRAPDRAEFTLTDVLCGLAHAREFTRSTLAGWRSDATVVTDALLAVTELLTNAILHGLGVPVLRLTARPGVLRVEVTDDSPALPAPRPAGPDGGWGLGVVERLSVAWGAERIGKGKVVWCELPDVAAGAAA